MSTEARRKLAAEIREHFTTRENGKWGPKCVWDAVDELETLHPTHAPSTEHESAATALRNLGYRWNGLCWVWDGSRWNCSRVEPSRESHAVACLLGQGFTWNGSQWKPPAQTRRNITLEQWFMIRHGDYDCVSLLQRGDVIRSISDYLNGGTP